MICAAASLASRQADAYEQGTYFILDVRQGAAESPVAGRIPIDPSAFDAAVAESPAPGDARTEDSEFVIDYDGFAGSGGTADGTNTIGGFGGNRSADTLPDFETDSNSDGENYPWNEPGGDSPFGSGDTP